MWDKIWCEFVCYMFVGWTCSLFSFYFLLSHYADLLGFAVRLVSRHFAYIKYAKYGCQFVSFMTFQFSNRYIMCKKNYI